MIRAILTIGLLFQGAESPTFEVASLKPAAPPANGRGPGLTFVRGGPGSSGPGQITSVGSLMFLMTIAYDVRSYQVLGPGWLESERFDVVAKVPHGATKEQTKVMLQNLL